MWSPWPSALKVAGKRTIGVGLSGAARLGDRFWGQNGPFECARGSGNGWLRPRSVNRAGETRFSPPKNVDLREPRLSHWILSEARRRP
jgi:hypothetical protein